MKSSFIESVCTGSSGLVLRREEHTLRFRTLGHTLCQKPLVAALLPPPEPRSRSARQC